MPFSGRLKDMSDLSKVLGDLYGGDEPPPASQSFRPTAPEWADESRLDEAFADWTPGPPPEAHATEREMSVVIDTPHVPAGRLDDDLAATLSAALVDAGTDNHDPDVPIAGAPSYSLASFEDEAVPSPAAATSYVQAAAEPLPEPAPLPVAVSRPWSRADDDIFPGHGPSRPTASVKAPKFKAPKVGKAAKAPQPVQAPQVHSFDAADQPSPAEVEAPAKKLFGLQLRRK